ncbi:hypothetical protein ACEWY4_001318 [Coilia grayii]|uniref:Transposase domain-containing protein n=1 Tax=Coilia grayii TaxID=363190 RepID=A0ABD1KSN2_9TELE
MSNSIHSLHLGKSLFLYFPEPLTLFLEPAFAMASQKVSIYFSDLQAYYAHTFIGIKVFRLALLGYCISVDDIYIHSVQRQKHQAISHAWMSVEARKKEYKRLWSRVHRKQSVQGNPVQDSCELTESFQDSEMWSPPNTVHDTKSIQQLESHQEEFAMDLTNSDTVHTDMSWDSVDDAHGNTLCEDLKKWTSEFGVKHNAVDALLRILRIHGHNELPCSTKTLLKTDHIPTQVVSGVECVRFSVTDQLSMCLDRYPKNHVEDIQLLEVSLNVDGLPLFKSTSKSFWPVLCTVHLKPPSTFPLVIALTDTKPKSLDFIKETTMDLKNVMMNGFEWGDKKVHLKLRCIICDAPAKAMLKCIKQFSGYYGCDKCTQQGSWCGRMTFQEVHNLTLRDDVSFREQHQAEHHQESAVSPLSDLQIDMVRAFPGDYMHQCCLGVTKKLLTTWSRGKTKHRLSQALLREVNERLLDLRRYIPDVFARKCRGLDDLERWKATEFRMFMLYTGKIVLKGILPDEMYHHFMAFSVAMCILVSPHLTKNHSTYAHELLTYVVEQGRFIYGEEFLVFNVHSLLHITADAIKYGSLDNCSAFHFESYLYQLKRMVRSGRNPLVQVAKRLQERAQSQVLPHVESPIKMKFPNNVYMVGPTSCCEVLERTASGKYLCRVYTDLKPYTNTPCDSRIYGTFMCGSTEIKLLERESLQGKAVLLEESHGHKVALSVLHELE